MTRSLIWAFVLTLALISVPQEADAGGTDCLDNYYLCINEAAGKYDDWGRDHFDLEDDAAYLECAAEYAGCIRKKLIGI